MVDLNLTGYLYTPVEMIEALNGNLNAENMEVLS